MKTNNSILFSIHNIYKDLTSSERKVADYILKNPLDVTDITIEILSEYCKTSISTVSRFTKKLNLENFYQLKLLIAKEFINPSKINSSNIENLDFNNLQTYSDIATINANILFKSIEEFDEERFEKVISSLSQKKNIYLFAMGTSGTLAVEAWNKFTRLGVKCFFTLDFHSQLLQASILDENDVAIIFSHSGINKDILNLVDTIKKTGAHTIGITNFSKTPFETSVDICLSFFNSYNIQNELTGLVSRVPLLLVIEAIYKTLGTKFYNEKLKDSYKEIFNKRSI
ncbi:MurR/RpiR family transcriptional regulator [Cetobacterium sp. 8H]|uniref:MurR/RpiR family transcriptional regulator n=1 Tax=Cetobacterium sp. 8H TaxID=2759681 RepID=UPI00163CA7D7|nr:MurR/RpiR family transcriptional regulator [Cetobacterium sp. 8H]MBC2849885.1 MurR/RpiR family transcriptional regulator [Cetobacterium sp. 8H]